MIKTKLFGGYYVGEGKDRKWINIDKEINSFLEQNKVEVIDIKFSSVSFTDDDIQDRALMIYKEVQPNE
ncbi:hypothetical protein V7150_16250 [Neobacillus drentensis]|uniref:hypothetical protein n=1 Tax=Neobacillus drentensis TaxID=220684 RepID=UPI00300059FA